MRHHLIIPSFLFIVVITTSIVFLQSKAKAQILNDASSSSPSSSSSSSSSSSDLHQGNSITTDLDKLTDKQLEEICTSRGFELVKDSDKNTGQPIHYSHQDYVDAARQCLEIEAEMERILKENPNLLQEIEEESRRMTEEKLALEEKLNQTTQGRRIHEKKKIPVDSDKSEKSTSTGFDYDDDPTTELKDDDMASKHDEETSSSTAGRMHSSGQGVRNDGESGTRLKHDLSGYRDVDSDVVDLDSDDPTSESDKVEDSLHRKISSESKDDNNNNNIKKKKKKKNNDGDDDDEMNGSSVVGKVQSTILNVLDVLKDQRLKLRNEFERIVPEDVRRYMGEIIRPLLLILESMVQSMLSLLRRYFVVVLEGLKRKIDTTLDGLSTTK